MWIVPFCGECVLLSGVCVRLLQTQARITVGHQVSLTGRTRVFDAFIFGDMSNRLTSPSVCLMDGASGRLVIYI